jgi:NagD protein
MTKSTFDTDAKAFSAIRHVVLDMDGTIYRGSEIFPFTLDFLRGLAERGIGYSFLTNNSSKSIDDYLKHLQKMNIPATREQLYTSGLSTIDYLKDAYPKLERVFLLGTQSLSAEFERNDFIIVDGEDEPEMVVVGFDTALNFASLCKAAWWISHGKPFFATHPDQTCPTNLPTVLVDCGAICACLTHATGVEPIAIPGKPNALMLIGIMKRHGLQPHEIVMVGDRLNTDVALAKNAGTMGVLVLTGASRREDVERLGIQPDFVMKSIEELGKCLGVK